MAGSYSRVGAFRLNTARLNYLHVPTPLTGVYLMVGGVWTDFSHKARVAGTTISQALNEVPDTATIRFDGDVGQPLKGQQIVISQTSPYGEPWMFSGHILNVRTIYEGRARNVAYDCDCIDYTWTLTFLKVTKRFVGATAEAIVYNLVLQFAPTFGVDATPDVPQTPIDEITFTNEDLGQAISRVCERLGLYWMVDHQRKTVRLFTSAALGSAGTITDSTPATIQTIAKAEDLAPVATIVYARGGGSTAVRDCVPGDTTLPILDAEWYALGGGQVECGPQIIGYYGVSNPGTGALVGSGNAPSGAPAVAGAVGSNLVQGAVYKYAVSFVTSAGETLPGATVAYTPVAATIAPAPPPVVGGELYDSGIPGGKMVPGGSYRWAWAKNISGGGLVPGTPTAGVTVTANYWRLRIKAELFDEPAVSGITPYRTTNGGSTFYADNRTLHRGDVGTLTTGDLTDAELAQGPVMGGGGATMLSAVLSQIPIYAKPGVATARKIYRTAGNGAQLKLVATIADNTTTSLQDTVTDAALGVNAPISDTSGIQGGGQIPEGAPSILVSDATAFSPNGGWVRVSGLVLRYTGVSGSSIVLAEPLPTTLSYGSEILTAPYLWGIPASGDGAIVYPIKSGDEVYVSVYRWDNTAVLNLKTWVGYGDGNRMEFLTDGRLGLPELTARADALLAYRKDPLVTITLTTRDPGVAVGKTITFNLTYPPIVGTFLIQRVEISELPSKAHIKPVPALRTVEASSRRFTFDDLVQQLKLVGRIN